MYSDFLLIRKMKQGEETAFDFFVRKYYPEILTYCYHHCPDKAYAEDMTQETFLRFFAKLPDYSYWGKTKNYLYTIAGKFVMMATQVTHEGSDMEVYRVGKVIKEEFGLMEAYDMTLEATVTKAMWALGQTKEPEAFRRLFYRTVNHDILLGED